MLWTCPHCQKKLLIHANENVYRCENRHCFDIAKEGYINLIPANQKNSKDPGDSKLMISSRRIFLAGMYYEPLAHILRELAIGADTILEVGCGEGYYLRHMSNQSLLRSSHQFYGIDISKHAIKAASKVKRSDSHHHYAVASSFDLPLQDGCMDMIVRNFAPAPSEEIARVLKDDGKFVVVTPGKRHLFQLRQHIYAKASEHDTSVTAVDDFTLVEQQPLQYRIDIKASEHIQALLNMTPYYWQTTKDKQQSLKHLEQLSCEVDIVISIYRKG